VWEYSEADVCLLLAYLGLQAERRSGERDD
jgi:hypothetical protein